MDDRGNYFMRHGKPAKSTANGWDGWAVQMAGPRLSDGRRPYWKDWLHFECTCAW